MLSGGGNDGPLTLRKAGDQLLLGRAKGGAGAVTFLDALTGAIQGHFHWQDTMAIQVRDLLPLAGGGLIVVGALEDQSFVARPWIARIAANGALVWQSQGTGNDILNHVVSDGAGGFVTTSQARLYHFDSAGTLLASLAPSSSVFSELAPSANGYLVTINVNGRPLVLSLAANLSINWQRTISPGPTGTFSLGKPVQASDGIYFAGSTDAAGAGDTDLVLVKLDNTGNVLWSVTLGTGGADQVGRVFESATGKVYVSGAMGQRAFVGRFTPSGSFELGGLFDAMKTARELQDTDAGVVFAMQGSQFEASLASAHWDLTIPGCANTAYSGEGLDGSVAVAPLVLTSLSGALVLNASSAGMVGSGVVRVDAGLPSLVGHCP